MHKAIIKDAAQVCRSYIFDVGYNVTDNIHGRNLCLSAISKCAVANDSTLERRITARDAYARKFLDVQEGKVIITNPEEFADEFMKVRSDLFAL